MNFCHRAFQIMFFLLFFLIIGCNTDTSLFIAETFSDLLEEKKTSEWVQKENKSELSVEDKISKNTICSRLKDITGLKNVCIPSELHPSSIKVNLSYLSENSSRSKKFEDLSRVVGLYDLNLDSITEVDLSHNKEFTEIPPFVFRLSSLKRLNISHTSISHWDKEMCQLKNLEVFIGSNNTYKDGEIPLHTFCLRNLVVLDMSSSEIRYLDEYVGKLSSLRELYLQGNQLTKLPLMVQHLPHLSVLHLQYNSFKDEDISQNHHCLGLEEDELEDCREDFLDTVDCTYHYPIPFQRGEPFRQMYVNLWDQTLPRLQHVDANLFTNKCYRAWLYTVDYNDPEILEKTIRGISVREFRYTASFKQGWSYNAGNLMCDVFHSNSYDSKIVGAMGHEVFPEYEDYIEIAMAMKLQDQLMGGNEYWIPTTKDTSEKPADCPHLDGLNLHEHIEKKSVR